MVTRKGSGFYVRDRPPLRRIASTHRHASHRASGKPEFDTEAIAQGQFPSRRIRVGVRTRSDQSVRDLGRVPVRCSCASEELERPYIRVAPSVAPRRQRVHAMQTAMIVAAGRLARQPDEASQTSIVASVCTIGGGPADGSTP